MFRTRHLMIPSVRWEKRSDSYLRSVAMRDPKEGLDPRVSPRAPTDHDFRPLTHGPKTFSPTVKSQSLIFVESAEWTDTIGQIRDLSSLIQSASGAGGKADGE